MKDKSKQPAIAEWKRLYELAAELKNLAHWEWMDETEIFGVENPDTKEIGFVSAMGMLGEHLSVGVYLGAKGLYGFWDFQEAGLEAEPFALFEIPQLQISFENREQLEKQDRDVIKKLDLKFRGSQNYPLFRSIRPGFLPWFITSDEARMLIYAIEQALEVAPRVRENPEILDDESDTKNEVVLMRGAEKQGAKLVWRDERREIQPPAEEEFTIAIPQGLIDELKAFPQAKNFVLEAALFIMPNPIAEKGKRPYFPKMLMLADGRSGMIAGFQLIAPKETDAENYVEISRHFFEALRKTEVRPQEILVGSDLLFDLLKGINQQLNIKLRQTDDLPAVEAAREGMFGFFGGLPF
ncbi:MAG: DUF7309 domain-containing protein [Pyrinomonadaceae bacterium]